jgi:preprotein translocase subunit SecE
MVQNQQDGRASPPVDFKKKWIYSVGESEVVLWPSMRQTRLLQTTLVVLACLAVSSQAYYILMREGEARCFSTDVPKDTLIVGTFSCQDASHEVTGYINEPIKSKNFGITIKVKDPLDRLIYNKNHEQDGKFAMTSHVGGQHQMCFQTNSSSWFNPATFVSSPRSAPFLLLIAFCWTKKICVSIKVE